MIFNSWPFIFVFLPICLGVFHFLANRRMLWAQIWVILASLLFYAYWKIEYLPLLLGSVGFNFTLVCTMNSSAWEGHRKFLLVLGLAFNVLLLGFFKYTNFFLATLKATALHVPGSFHVVEMMASHVPGPFDIVLPLAISFFTFTQIAYLIDAYWDRNLRHSFLDYSFLVVFFPHLIAGPIVRGGEILPQLKDWGKRLGFQTIAVGLMLFTMGLCKKCLIADALSPHVENVFGSATQGVVVGMKDAWMGAIAFSFQIYYDFSAYSDMALGLALMFGMRFPVNFNSPYTSLDVTDFWRRWHMSLSRFLRDYIHTTLSLACTRRAVESGCRSFGMFMMSVFIPLFITFLISGIWHGAGWNFVIWGGLYGLCLIVAHAWRDFTRKVGFPESAAIKWLARGFTFGVVVLINVWFRAAHVHSGWALTRSMLGLQSGFTGTPLIGSSLEAFLPVLLLIAWFLPNTQQLLADYEPALGKVDARSSWKIKLNYVSVFILGVVFLIVTKELFVTKANAFIYFKF